MLPQALPPQPRFRPLPFKRQLRPMRPLAVLLRVARYCPQHSAEMPRDIVPAARVAPMCRTPATKAPQPALATMLRPPIAIAVATARFTATATCDKPTDEIPNSKIETTSRRRKTAVRVSWHSSSNRRSLSGDRPSLGLRSGGARQRQDDARNLQRGRLLHEPGVFRQDFAARRAAGRAVGLHRRFTVGIARPTVINASLEHK